MILSVHLKTSFQLMYSGFRARYIFRVSQLRFYHNNIKTMQFVKLSSTKDKMPTVGLGTWQAPADVTENTVFKALEVGYRHIDTAFNYNNEEAIGEAIAKWIRQGNGVREDLFITTKLPHIGNRASDVRYFLLMQLERLKLTYVDLYLIHLPFAFVCDKETLTPQVTETGDYVLDTEIDHVKTWKAMELCQKEGLIRNIGLSNFNERQISNIIAHAELPPQVLQVELHATFQQLPLRKFCEEHGIVVTAYAPLGSPGAKAHYVKKYNYKAEAFPDLLNNPIVTSIADKYGRTTAQILLHYLVKNNIVVIPKSTSEKRLKENLNIFDFDLAEGDFDQLKSLDRGEKGRIFNFLVWKGVEKHPEYPFDLSERQSSQESTILE